MVRLSGVDFVNVQQVDGAGVRGHTFVQWSGEDQSIGVDLYLTEVPCCDAHLHLKGDRSLKCVQECEGHDLKCWTLGLLEPEVWIRSRQLHEVYGGEEPRLDVVSDDGGSIFLGGEPLLGVCPGSEEPLVPPKLHDGFIGCGGLGCYGDHLDPVVVTGVGDWVTSHGCLKD